MMLVLLLIKVFWGDLLLSSQCLSTIILVDRELVSNSGQRNPERNISCSFLFLKVSHEVTDTKYYIDIILS